MQQDELSVRRDPGVASRVVQQHECKQAQRLRLVGHQNCEQLAQADRLVAELSPDVLVPRRRCVALVEHEVEHREHGPEPVGEEMVGRDPERDAGRPDLPFCTHESLRHRRLGDEKGPRDLGRRQAADLAQRQRDLRIDCERWVTACEDECQPVVGDRAHIVVLVR